jgi:hypothetical protein
MPESKKELANLSTLSERGNQIILHNIFSPFGKPEEYENILAKLAGFENSGIYFAVQPSERIVIPCTKLLPDWLMKEKRSLILSKLHDSWLSKKIYAELQEMDPKDMRIVHAPHHAPLIGLSLYEFMNINAIRDERQALLRLMRETGLRALLSIKDPQFKYRAQAMEYPSALLGSFELGAYRSSWNSFDHPSSFTDLLWRTEQKGIDSLSTLFEKTSALPARLFDLNKRGVIREGMNADIIIFKNKSLKMTIVNGMLAYPDKINVIPSGKPLVKIAQ